MSEKEGCGCGIMIILAVITCFYGNIILSSILWFFNAVLNLITTYGPTTLVTITFSILFIYFMKSFVNKKITPSKRNKFYEGYYFLFGMSVVTFILWYFFRGGHLIVISLTMLLTVSILKIIAVAEDETQKLQNDIQTEANYCYEEFATKFSSERFKEESCEQYKRRLRETRKRKIKRAEQEVQNIIHKHLNTLCVKKRNLIIVDDYGIIKNKSKWEAEKKYFIKEVVLPQFGSLEDLSLVADGQKIEVDVLKKIGMRIDSCVDNSINTYNSNSIEINSGEEYEVHCCLLLEKSGWETSRTSSIGDQGVDILARKNGKVLAIQCKYYSSPVGNKAVQEVVAGIRHYSADMGAVVSNAGYTSSAKTLAKSNDIYLLHHFDLEKILL